MARATAEATISSSQARPGLDLLADVCKFGKLNGTEREELFLSFENGGSGVRDVLHSWSRRQLKDYLNMKTGVEKKYTSYSKHKLIDLLLNSRLTKYDELRMPCPDEVQHAKVGVETVTYKVGKGVSPSRDTNLSCIVSITTEQRSQTGTICENSACRGKLSVGDLFCKRCSCCICHMFDDNKDPSLWIVCNNGIDSKKGGCNLSCHLECALKLQIAGVVQRETVSLDGSFCCPSCRTVSDLLGCIEKQLLVAKEARRIDILCYRLYLAYRLLNGTTQYQKLFSILREAAHKLEEEIGPLSEASGKLVRGIVSRLSTGAQVQKLLQCALQELEQQCTAAAMSQTGSGLGLQGDKEREYILHFTEITSSSITVSWQIPRSMAAEEATAQKLWHRKVSDMDFLSTPTIQLSSHEQKARLCDLEAGTEYAFKLLAFSRKVIVAQSEGVSCTKDTNGNLHNRTSEIPPKASAKSGVMHLGAQNLAKQSSSSISIDDQDTTFKVRNLGYALHRRQLELSATRQVLSKNQEKCGREGLKCEHPGSQTSDALVPSDINGCVNAPTEPRSAVILCDQGNKDQTLPSTARTQEKVSTSNFDPDLSKLTIEMPIKHQPATNRSTLDTPIQSECVMHLLNDEFASSLSRSKDSGDSAAAHPSESAPPVDLPADISTSKDPSAAHCTPHDCEIENVTESNSQQQDELFQLIVHPSVEGDIALDPRSRKRTAAEFHQSQNLTRWEELPYQQQAGPLSKADDFFEFWVKVVRWLECEGHLEAHFRMRFLSWLGLRATEREKRVITAFFNAMLNDPSSLAEQLMDTFQEIVSKPRAKVVA